MNTQQILQAICMDLKRVAIGYNRGSSAMGKQFLAEALKRKNEIKSQELKPYIQKILKQLDGLAHEENTQKIAEDTLVYSIVIQNYCLKQSLSSK